MLLIIGVFHAHTLAAIGGGGAAFEAKSAYFALVYLTKRNCTLLADMLGPVTALDAVFAAVASLVFGVGKTALGAKLAIITDFKAVVKEATLTLRAYYAAVNAVVAAVPARLAERIAVAALCAVHIFLLYTIFAPTAVRANKSTGGAFPTVSTKRISVVRIAFAALGTVQTFFRKAVFTELTLVAGENVAV